ncbi:MULTISPECIES: MDR family MFS transporter [Metabacillus]|uniref:MFS transporter n=2 Tax=Metabacillus TaxID=2675233 RepID=A0A179T7J0_9BACI|nr:MULTISPECIES: MFS transporter [Metabacillus]OAS88352.1 MFS transporter [Metabacillus litoralis]QNF28080.1 MFS transporter [Metabacillus sp. KUDC1714]
MRIRDWDYNLKIRLFGEALMNITFWMFFPFLTIYFADAFGKEQAGLFLIISQVFSVLANLMGGYCADRFGRKTMMVLSAFGQGLAFIIFAFSNSPWLDLPILGFICFSFAGVFGAFYWPASQAMVADVVDEKDRSSVFAIFYTSINIAVVIGPILGAIFYVHYPFEVLLIAGIVCMLLSLLLAKQIRETAPVFQAKSNEASGKWYYAIVQQIQDYRIIMKDSTFLLFIIAGVLVAITFMQLDMIIPVYITDMVHHQEMIKLGDWSLSLNGEQAFGVILSENGLLVALFTISVTKWMGKYQERNVFILSSIIYGLSIITFGLSGSIWVFIVAMGLFTFAELMTAGIQQTFVSKIAPDHMRGQYFAAASLRYTIGRTIAPIAIPMSLWFGYPITFALLGALAVFSGALYYLMFQKVEKKTLEHAESI